MASNNQLLGSGINYVALARTVPRQDEVQKLTPAWRYHKDCPQGLVVKTDAALEKLDADGWVDHPGKVSPLPGHEDLFEGKTKKTKSKKVEKEEEVEEVEEVDTDSLLNVFGDSDKGSKIDHS